MISHVNVTLHKMFKPKGFTFAEAFVVSTVFLEQRDPHLQGDTAFGFINESNPAARGVVIKLCDTITSLLQCGEIIQDKSDFDIDRREYSTHVHIDEDHYGLVVIN